MGKTFFDDALPSRKKKQIGFATMAEGLGENRRFGVPVSITFYNM